MCGLKQPHCRISRLPGHPGPSTGCLDPVLEEEAEPAGKEGRRRGQPALQRRQPVLHLRHWLSEETSLTALNFLQIKMLYFWI